MFEFSHEQEPESNSIPTLHYKDLHFSIALEKIPKHVAKGHFNFIQLSSFEHSSPTHKAFLTSLDTITIQEWLSKTSLKLMK